MEKEKIKEWLDAVVDMEEQRKKLAVPDGKIRLCGTGERILLYSGIEEIAEAVGLELSHYTREGNGHHHVYQVIYKGTAFRQIEQMPLKTGSTQGGL